MMLLLYDTCIGLLLRKSSGKETFMRTTLADCFDNDIFNYFAGEIKLFVGRLHDYTEIFSRSRTDFNS